jgi:hypothetical protein
MARPVFRNANAAAGNGYKKILIECVPLPGRFARTINCVPVIRPLRPCDAEVLGGGMLMGSDGVEGERTFKALAGGTVKMPKRGRGFGRGGAVGVVEFLP